MKRNPDSAGKSTATPAAQGVRTECWACQDTGYLPDTSEWGEEAGAECGLCDRGNESATRPAAVR